MLNLLIVFILSTCSSFGFENNIQYAKIPYGISQDVLLATEINSQSAVIGQEIEAILPEDFKYNSLIIAPKGSIIKGAIVFNKKALSNQNALTKIRFTTIITPYNNKIPISATIKTKDLKGVLTQNGEKKILIPSNTMITLYFDQPITLSAQ